MDVQGYFSDERIERLLSSSIEDQPMQPTLPGFAVSSRFQLGSHESPFIPGSSLRGIWRSYFRYFEKEEIFQKLYNRVSSLERRTERVERVLSIHGYLMEHAVRPLLAHRAKEIEWFGAEKDSLPPAASPEYEWVNLVSKAAHNVQEMLDDFNDLHNRLSHYVSLIQKIDDLLKLTHSMDNRDLRFAVLTLHDSLLSVYSEDMTIDQANVIQEVLEKMRSQKWDRDKLRDLDRLLRKNGFETIPSDTTLIGSNNGGNRT